MAVLPARGSATRAPTAEPAPRCEGPGAPPGVGDLSQNRLLASRMKTCQIISPPTRDFPLCTSHRQCGPRQEYHPHCFTAHPSNLNSLPHYEASPLAGGMIAVGVATLRKPRLWSWRRYAPLICGLMSLVVIPIQLTSALWLGITVLCLGYVLLGAAVISDGAYRTDHAIQIA